MSPNGRRSERSETSMAALVAAAQPRASLVREMGGGGGGVGGGRKAALLFTVECLSS